MTCRLSCLCCVMLKWSGWTSKVSRRSVFHCSREMPMCGLSAAEAAGGAGSRAERWTATPCAALLWSLSLWQSCSRQSRHCRRHLFHQKVICNNTRELSGSLFSLFISFYIAVARQQLPKCCCWLNVGYQRYRWAHQVVGWWWQHRARCTCQLYEHLRLTDTNDNW